MKISVITPTYNRATLLKRCYNSLCEQKFPDMEWIIVDDGSIDETEKVIKSFIGERKINIKYFFQQNGGKHVAHNTGVNSATGVLTFCLDSDDYLPSNSLFRVWEIWESVCKFNFIGVIGKRGTLNGSTLCSDFPEKLEAVYMFELNNKYHFQGDTILIFRTDILKNKYFPSFENERFLPENALYYELDENGKMYIANEVLYIGEYQDNGLTSRYHQLLKNNPIGTTYTYSLSYKKAYRLKDKLRYFILTSAYWVPDCKKYFNVNKKILFFRPVAILYKKYILDRI